MLVKLLLLFSRPWLIPFLPPPHNTTRKHNTGTEETLVIIVIMRAHLSLLMLAAFVATFLGLATVTSAADPKDCEGKDACENAGWG